MRKFVVAGLIAGLLIGTALGQTPAPAPAPAPVVPPAPVNPPAPAPPVPVTIQGETSVPCYGFARLTLAGTYTSAGWLCFPDRTTGARLVSSYTTPNGHVFVFSGPPGAYDVGAFAQTPTGIVTVQTVVTIQPATPPPSPPTPAPNPQPAPPTPAPTPTPKPFPSTQRQPFPSTRLDGEVRRG